LKVRFISPADIELDETIQYYDYQLPGLGFRFFQEVNAALEKIGFMPKAWTRVGERTRRYILKGFPHALLYIIEPEEILVTAVACFHRDPKHYRDRID